jgi:hypothetical protein
MKSIKLSLIYGFLLWLIPFIIAFMIYPLKKSGSPLFETIMTVTLTLCVVLFSILYFKKLNTGFVLESIKLGILWFVISVVMDLLMFMWGPMKMTFSAYMADIGLTYLIYPIVTVGFGYMMEKIRKV